MIRTGSHKVTEVIPPPRIPRRSWIEDAPETEHHEDHDTPNPVFVTVYLLMLLGGAFGLVALLS